MAFGLLLLLFTASFIYDMYHPERQRPNDYFGILFVPFHTARRSLVVYLPQSFTCKSVLR
jgi:hypothetical protein